jgi:hypothetical protein
MRMQGARCWSWMTLTLLLALPAGAAAQVQSLKEFHVDDVQTLHDKFGGLAEAISEDLYDWRPMEGVRSVREVLALAVAEANLFPSMWGATRPSGIGEGFGGEMERITAMNKAEIMAELDRSFDYMKGALAGMSDADRMADGNTFGTEMKVDAGITYAMTDMHEHLGQLIAYARMNHIVPPWSR